MNGGQGPLLIMSPAGVANCVNGIKAYGLAEGPDGSIWVTTNLEAELFKLSPTGWIQPGFPIALEGSRPRGVATTKDGHARRRAAIILPKSLQRNVLGQRMASRRMER